MTLLQPYQPVNKCLQRNLYFPLPEILETRLADLGVGFTRNRPAGVMPKSCCLLALCLTLCFQGPHYWVLKGSRALTIRSLEAQGKSFIRLGGLVSCIVL